MIRFLGSSNKRKTSSSSSTKWMDDSGAAYPCQQLSTAVLFTFFFWFDQKMKNKTDKEEVETGNWGERRERASVRAIRKIELQIHHYTKDTIRQVATTYPMTTKEENVNERITKIVSTGCLKYLQKKRSSSLFTPFLIVYL